MAASPAHPSWCEYPQAPNDATHTHTAAIGTTYVARDTAIELVLVQPPESAHPMLTLHVTTPSARLSIDLTGVQAWALAGVLIDATVAHAHAVPSRANTTTTKPPTRPSSRQPTDAARPLWLLDGHPNGRMPRLRTSRRPFRCRPRHHPPNNQADNLEGPDPTE